MSTTDPGPLVSVRRASKMTVFALALLLVSPLIAVVWLEKHLSRSEAVFVLCSQTLALVPGFIGWWLRAAYYAATLQRCSWETHIGFGSLFTHRAAVVGCRVSTGAYCVFGHVDLGADAMIGSRVSIPSGKRQHLGEDGQLAKLTRFDRVGLGSHCWIGEGAILLADVGAHSIVAAGAVVIDPMPGNSIIAGNPGRVLRRIEEDTPAVAVD